MAMIKVFPQYGASVVLITHNEAVATVADRASLLDQGTIVQTGDPETIARAFRAQAHETSMHAPVQ